MCIRGICDGSDKDVIMVCVIGRIDSFVLWQVINLFTGVI